MSPRLFFRAVAIAEAITWTLLIIGLILKYVVQAGDLGVRIGGSIHGFVFLVYAASVVVVGVNQRWRFGTIAVGVVSAVVPYATIPFDVWADRRGKLDGLWRRETTDDPRDARWFDRLLRWLLRHPVAFGAIFVVGVVVVFTVLLVVGPPVPKA
ncbi:DUF3817 domain-containing protein [Plantibacter sp. YIM 135347]|uniref:DUF3817 domain-containing protein n=1 Tax=Plantibacter sp. YIM 135347 TaxID=3423919 RepID=UPI003D3575FC